MLNRNGERGHLCLVPDKGESLQSFAIKYISGNVFVDAWSNKQKTHSRVFSMVELGVE